MLQLGKNTTEMVSPPCIYKSQIIYLELLEFLQIFHEQNWWTVAP